jgi:hypothetical protein
MTIYILGILDIRSEFNSRTCVVISSQDTFMAIKRLKASTKSSNRGFTGKKVTMRKAENPEYDQFSKAMETILKANPEAVKAAMEAEKRDRAMEAERTGKRGRGRPSKHSSASSRASYETD